MCRPDVYGASLTICRSVTASGGGGYKIKDEAGRVVVAERAREEVDRILAAFGIQTSNPIAILNQVRLNVQARWMFVLSARN